MGRQRRATALLAVALLAGGLAAPARGEAQTAPGVRICIDPTLYSCQALATGIATGVGFELGLYVPGRDGRPRDVSGGASSCPGCRWDVVPACEGNTPGTTGEDLLTCNRASMACASTGGTLVDVYLKRPGEPWRAVSSFCSNPAQQVTTPAQIVDAAASVFADMELPRPGVQYQPPGGTAVNLPTVFYSDDTAPITIGVTLRGFSASLTATPQSWQWDFGDGTTLTTTSPGAAYPNHSITHTYRRRGSVTATVTTTWVGSVSVPEMGDLPITETVTRTSARVVTVREARTELVDPAER